MISSSCPLDQPGRERPAAVAPTHSDLSECAEELALLEELERITCRKLELVRASGNAHS